MALHAIADALLGAAGMGDLGRLFPSGPATPAGIASSVLLAEVVGRVHQAGLEVRSIDLTIVAGRPRLAGSLDAMRESIWAIIGGVFAIIAAFWIRSHPELERGPLGQPVIQP